MICIPFPHGSNPVRARPVVSGFIRCFLQADELEKSYFVGLRFAAADGTASARGVGRVVDLRPAGTAFVELGTKWAERSAHCPTARMLVRHTARSELPTSLRTRDATQLPFEDEQDAAAMVGVQGTLT